MVGAAGAGFAGASGGEETVGGDGARGAEGAALEVDSGATAAGLAALVSLVVPLRLPNTTVLHELLRPQFLDQG